MQLSFFISTVLYLSLILLIHYKIRDKFPKDIPIEIKKRPADYTDTIISLDDVDKDIDSQTIKDLKKFLATPELDLSENFSPIVEHSELDNYFDNSADSPNEPIEIPDAIESGKSCDSSEVKEDIVEDFADIAAFDDFGGYQNFATV